MPKKNNNLDKILKHIESYLSRVVQEAMVDEVAKTVQEAQQDSVQKNVYDVYSPRAYTRRGDGSGIGDGGGLGDTDNMRVDSLDGKLGISVTNITPPNPNYPHGSDSRPYIARAVEEGRGYMMHNPGPRPFIQPTIDSLKSSGAHISALKKALKDKGLNVK